MPNEGLKTLTKSVYDNLVEKTDGSLWRCERAIRTGKNVTNYAWLYSSDDIEEAKESLGIIDSIAPEEISNNRDAWLELMAVYYDHNEN